MEASAPPLLPGLELLRPIGRGSFGEVWLARTVTGQYRAVKLVPLGTEGSGLQALGERVFRGVQAYLDHLPPGSPAALAVLHVDRDPEGRFLYYVMELADDVAGGRAFAPEHYQALTLSEFRRRAPGQWVPAPETIRLGRQLAEGLATLHAAGLVHRDIKPNNVVFIGGEPRLADIDLVRPAEASLSLGGAQGYSPLEGPGRPTADVFSLGRTLYATVTGLPVGEFPRLPEDWDQRPDAADLQRLNAVLLRACDPDPARRHQHGAELAEDFRRLEQGEDVARSRQQRSRTRRIALAVAGLTGLLALAAFLLVPAFRQRTEQVEFERYRKQLGMVARNPLPSSTNAFGGAHYLLRNIGYTPIELHLISRQADDVQLGHTGGADIQDIQLVTGVSIAPVRLMSFSSDATRLVALCDTDAYIVDLISGTTKCVIHNVLHVCGWCDADPLLAAITAADNKNNVLGLWNADTGQQMPQRLTGSWSSGTVLSDAQTIIALSVTNGVEVVARWQPFGTLPPESSVISTVSSNPTSVLRVASSWRFHCSPTGDRVVIWGYGDRGLLGAPTEIYCYSAQTNKSALHYRQLSRGGGFDDISSADVSPDGRWIAESSQESNWLEIRRIGEWIHKNYDDLNVFPGGSFTTIAFSKSGKRLALADHLNVVRLIDSHKCYSIASPAGMGIRATSIAWSNDESEVAIAGANGEVRVVRNVPRKHKDPNITRKWLGAAFDRHGHAVMFCDTNETIMALGYSGGFWVLDCGEFVFKHCPHNSGSPLKLSGERAEIWNVDGSGIVKRSIIEDVREIQMKWKEGGTVSLAPHISRSIASAPEQSFSGSASPDGRRFLVHRNDRCDVWAAEGDDVRRIVEIHHPAGSEFTDEAISTDSRSAVVLADDGSALLVDLDTGSSRQLKQLNEKAVTACFRPDSTECYFGTNGGRLLRLNTATDDPPELLDANLGLPAHMIATPDGERLLTAGPGEQLGIRRLSDGAPIVQLTHHGLALEPGRHNLKRLLYLPKQQRIVSLSEDGWLTQW